MGDEGDHGGEEARGVGGDLEVVEGEGDVVEVSRRSSDRGGLTMIWGYWSSLKPRKVNLGAIRKCALWHIRGVVAS